MQTETIRLTYEDYALIPPDGRRHEIIDGEEVMSPAPLTKHQRVAFRLALELELHVREHGLGEVFVAPFDVLLSDYDIVQPDVLFIADDRLRIVDEANCKGAPDLVCEVLSPSTRRTDLVRKRALYARFGVAEYWTLDPAVDQVQVFRPSGPEAYERAAELGMDGTLSTPLMPSLALPVAGLFG
ncbi:MAG: Uma2 family endonuclease [Bacteroidota bacterium]